MTGLEIIGWGCVATFCGVAGVIAWALRPGTETVNRQRDGGFSMVMGKAHSSVGKKAAKAQSTGAKSAVKSGAKTVTPGAAKSSGGSKPAFGSAAWDARYGVGKAKRGK